MLVLGPAVAILAGCGAGPVTARTTSQALLVTPGSGVIDTNCTGCNGRSARGTPLHRFSATLPNGDAAAVEWSVAGGDAAAGTGSISATGQYTPPNYLSQDRVDVVVTAALKSNPSVRAESVLTLTPGFL